jgi:hypothetical protein
MLQAFKKYEDNLQDAKEQQKLEMHTLNESVEADRQNFRAQLKAK